MQARGSGRFAGVCHNDRYIWRPTHQSTPWLQGGCSPVSPSATSVEGDINAHQNASGPYFFRARFFPVFLFAFTTGFSAAGAAASSCGR